MMKTVAYLSRNRERQQNFDLLYDVHDLACVYAYDRPKWTPFKDKLAAEIRRLENEFDCLDGIISLLKQGVGLTADDLVQMGFWWRKPSNAWSALRRDGYDLVAFRTGHRQRRYYLREFAPNVTCGGRRV
jgi:hypothetical protein